MLNINYINYNNFFLQYYSSISQTMVLGALVFREKILDPPRKVWRNSRGLNMKQQKKDHETRYCVAK